MTEIQIFAEGKMYPIVSDSGRVTAKKGKGRKRLIALNGKVRALPYYRELMAQDPEARSEFAKGRGDLTNEEILTYQYLTDLGLEEVVSGDISGKKINLIFENAGVLSPDDEVRSQQLRLFKAYKEKIQSEEQAPVVEAAPQAEAAQGEEEEEEEASRVSFDTSSEEEEILPGDLTFVDEYFERMLPIQFSNTYGVDSKYKKQYADAVKDLVKDGVIKRASFFTDLPGKTQAIRERARSLFPPPAPRDEEEEEELGTPPVTRGRARSDDVADLREDPLTLNVTGVKTDAGEREERERALQDPRTVTSAFFATGDYKTSADASAAKANVQRAMEKRVLELGELLQSGAARDSNEVARKRAEIQMNADEVDDIERVRVFLQRSEAIQLEEAGYDPLPSGVPSVTSGGDSGGNPFSDPDDDDPDGAETDTLSAEDPVPLNNTVILPTSPYKPKYHLDAIRFMYGNVDVPNWDPSVALALQKSGLSKDAINKYIDTLIATYGSKMLIFKRKSNGDIVELNEVMQLQYSIERGMQIGPRARQAVVSVADLVKFDNSLRTNASVAPPPPASEVTPLPDVQKALEKTENAGLAPRGRNVFERDTYDQRTGARSSGLERVVNNPFGIQTNTRRVTVGPSYDAFDI